MERHRHLSDLEFEKQFENCSLDPSIFSHEAHLRLAWIHIQKYGEDQACIRISNQILKFATTAGDNNKFNKTVTVAAIKAVNHFILKSKSTNFQDFMRESSRLKYNFKELLSYHYGFDIFTSEKARLEYLEPDLLPF